MALVASRTASPNRHGWCSWADRVVVGVGEPGGEGEPDVGDAVDGAQLGQVLDLDAARPELGDLGGDVVHVPGGLGRLVGGAGGAMGDDQPATRRIRR
jgi:hypothetical protein